MTFVGLDVHKDSISVGVLRPGGDAPDVERIFHDEDSVRRLITRFPDRALLRACYEAGPTGYELVRLLRGMGVSCQVIAPALIPRAPGDKVKTDKRDCRRLARLLRAGELVSIRIPTEREEAVRDLCRARADMVADVQRARRRMGSFLLRHGKVYRAGSAWTLTHERWLSSLEFDEPALRSTFCHYRAVVAARDAELRALEQDLAQAAREEPFAEPVRRLAAYRGVAELGALTLATEVCDWRRFAQAPAFMGFTGLTPSEYSSGSSSRRGRITKTGPAHLRTQLVESAWAYQHRPIISQRLRERHDHVPEATIVRSWQAQLRLCRRFKRLAARKNDKGVVVVAIARELAGFLWAEMTAEPAVR
ncbi:MAG: IS110 family transposase [Actinomycetota bacterium]|nr:IS110 family transposase [Actinomycetota bacterium]